MSTAEAELKALMLRTRGGDQAAYRQLLDRLAKHLRTYIRRLLEKSGAANAADVEDLVQDVLIAIHNRQHTYDPGYPLTVWVHAVARYKVIDFLRASKGRRRSVPIDDVDGLTTEPQAPAVEAGYDVGRLLEKLPPNMRRPIEEVKLKGRSITEAAEATGLSESAVKIGIHRGLKKLASLLKLG